MRREICGECGAPMYYALRNEPPEIGFLKDDARRAGEGEQQ